MSWGRRTSRVLIPASREDRELSVRAIAISVVVPIIVALIGVSVPIVIHLLSVSSTLGSVETGLNDAREEIKEVAADVDLLQTGVGDIKERVARIEGKLDPYQPTGAYWREDGELWSSDW